MEEEEASTPVSRSPPPGALEYVCPEESERGGEEVEEGKEGEEEGELNGGEWTESLAVTRNVSLARASTTPKWAVLFVPIVAISTHLLFLYGQMAVMWKLSLTAEKVDVWANATTTEAFIAYDSLGLPHRIHYQLDDSHTIETFTYLFAIKELWNMNEASILPQLAALLLVVFSGVWPHLKLLWLQHTWFTNRPHAVARRTSTLQWLALLGKWSLADVFTVCVMVGVLHLNWIIDPPLIRQGIQNHLQLLINLVQHVFSPEQLCQKFLNKDCTHSSFFSDCRACLIFVHEAYYHPDMAGKTGKSIIKGIHMSGGGEVRLSVVGMKGIYAFCAAVFISVLLSLLIDIFNDTHNRREKLHQRLESEAQHLALNIETATNNNSTDNHYNSTDNIVESEITETLISDTQQPQHYEPFDIDEGSVFSQWVERTRVNNPATQKLIVVCHSCLWPWITCVLVICAAFLPSMERKVDGAIPIILQDILGIDWERRYSLWTLTETTGYAGKWDYLLMTTFALFCVIGPVVRALLMCFLTSVQNKSTDHDQPSSRMLILTTLLQFLGAFCAWEVFVVAMFMVELLMPTITDTIIQTSACAQISDDGSCLQVAFERQDAFYTIIFGGLLLWAYSSRAVRLQCEKEERVYRNVSTDDNTLMEYVILDDEEEPTTTTNQQPPLSSCAESEEAA